MPGGPRAVISDVHANLEALEAVLSDIDKRGITSILFLGDAVGYGPNPNEAVSVLAERSEVFLAGNHDRAAIGLTDGGFNPRAREAILWTARVLTEESKKTIAEFKLTVSLPEDDVFLVHSTPRKPEEWHYLLSYEDAEDAFRHFRERICFVGHSHMPFILELLPDGSMRKSDTGVEHISGQCRYIINAGSVGQPRDRDPRACYAVYDGDRFELVRVEYPIKKTQDKMRAAGLPEPLIERLSHGI